MRGKGVKDNGLRIPVRSKKNRQEKDSDKENDEEKVTRNICEAGNKARLNISIQHTDMLHARLHKTDSFGIRFSCATPFIVEHK
jgi:hypothetical protein